MGLQAGLLRYYSKVGQVITLIPNAVYRLQKDNGGSMTAGQARWKNLLHATIAPANILPQYQGGLNAPNATILCDVKKKRLTPVQHIQLGLAARALANKPGGVQTNRDNVIQWELAGYLGSAGGVPKGELDLETVGDWYWEQLAQIMGPVVNAYYIRNRAPQDWSPRGRMSFSQWDSWDGWCGHVHAPENDHIDLKPNIGVLLSKIYEAPPKTEAPVVKSPTITIGGEVKAPAWPLRSGDYFGVESSSPTCHSGKLSAVDRGFIRTYQDRMRRGRGWNGMDVDGFFGPTTQSITRQFQSQKGLTPDGKVGQKTWTAAWSTPIT